MSFPLVVAGAARSGTAAMASMAAGLLSRPVHEAGAALASAGAWGEWATRYDRAMAQTGQPTAAPPPEAALANLPRDAVLRAADVLPTADSLRALPILLRAWPEARAICVWRHGMSFVDSRRRAFPKVSFADHCLTWAASQQAIAALRDGFGDRVLVVGRHEAAADVARRVATFLDLPAGAPWEMDWPGHADAPLTLAQTSWTLPEIDLFSGLCGPAMRRIGHPPDNAAAARTRPLDLLEVIRAGQAVTDGGLRLGRRPGPHGVRLRLSPGEGSLCLPLLWPAGRAQLALQLKALHWPVELELRVRGSLSRRQVLQRALRLEPGTLTEIEAVLPDTDELLDLMLIGAPAESVDVDLHRGRLSVV